MVLESQFFFPKLVSGKYTPYLLGYESRSNSSAEYSGALANPLLAYEGSLNRLKSSILENFVAVSYSHRFLLT